MGSSDLDAAIEAARAARDAAEADAARKRAEEERERAKHEAAADRLRQQLREVGTQFVAHARRTGIRADASQVKIGERDVYEGWVFRTKKPGRAPVYERRDAWTILPYSSGNSYVSTPPREGIYVLDDGRVVGSLHDLDDLPYGSLEQVTKQLAEYLAAREGG